MMVRTRHWVVGIAALAVAVGVLLIGFLAGSATFREAYLADIGGTMIGVLLGFIVAWALLLYERHQAEAEATAQLRRSRGDVLDVIRLELEDLQADLKDRTTGDGERVVNVPPLTSDVWRAISASGQLRAIREPQLLRWIARAHRFIGQTRMLEEAYTDWQNSAKSMWGKGGNPYLQILADTDGTTLAAIDEALHAVKNAQKGQVLGRSNWPDIKG